MAAQSDEHKMARTLAKSLDQNSFNPEYFARVLQEMPVASQEMLFRVFGESIKAWSERHDSGDYVNGADINLCTYAKRIEEVLNWY